MKTQKNISWPQTDSSVSCATRFSELYGQNTQCSRLEGTAWSLPAAGVSFSSHWSDAWKGRWRRREPCPGWASAAAGILERKRADPTAAAPPGLLSLCGGGRSRMGQPSKAQRCLKAVASLEKPWSLVWDGCRESREVWAQWGMYCITLDEK